MPRRKTAGSSTLSGFKVVAIHFPSEEMGKDFRDFCAIHSLTTSQVAAKIISDYLISRGLSSCQPLPPIEALKRMDDRLYGREDSQED